MHEDIRGPIGETGDVGPQGPTGDRGMPGPYCAKTELELLTHLIGELERADRRRQPPIADGTNPVTIVDAFVVEQAARALKNYEALLSQPIYQLIPPGFFDIDRPAKTLKSVR